MVPSVKKVKFGLEEFQSLTSGTNNFAFEVKVILSMEKTSLDD